MTTSQVLQEARRKIEGGWIKGIRFLADERGAAYCLVGAIEYTTEIGLEQNAAFLALAGQIDPDYCGFHHSACIEYNDHPQRTKQQVLALLDKALVEVTK